MRFLVQVLFLSLFLHGIASQESIHTLHQNIEGDPDLEAYLREAIENFREQMKTGLDAIHMPVLDPLHLRNLDINVKENLAEIDLRIKQIFVEGFSQFQFHNITPDLENFYLQVNLTLPRVTSWGKYDLKGKIVKIFPLRGDGNFQINITRGEISGVGQLDFKNDTLQMTQLELDLTWQKLDILLENFLGGGKFSEVLQNMIPNLGKGVFDTFKPEILKLMNTALIDAVNKELRKPEVKKIVAGILPS